MLSFFKNFLLSTSFVLQKQRRIPSIGVSLNQWTGIIVSSLLGFSKSRMTSFTNFRSVLLKYFVPLGDIDDDVEKCGRCSKESKTHEERLEAN